MKFFTKCLFVIYYVILTLTVTQSFAMAALSALVEKDEGWVVIAALCILPLWALLMMLCYLALNRLRLNLILWSVMIVNLTLIFLNR